MISGFEIDWIDTSVPTSPAVCTLPSTVTSAMPKMSDFTLASAGM